VPATCSADLPGGAAPGIRSALPQTQHTPHAPALQTRSAPKRAVGIVLQQPEGRDRCCDAGVLVGLSVHDPLLLQMAEDEGWDIDYYMTALYNLRGGRDEFEQKFGYSPLGEIYLREHRSRMCGLIRMTSKPCIAFKVLAAGRAIASRERIREEFAFALRNIKPSDAILVGMYQQFDDQVAENAAIVSEALPGTGERGRPITGCPPLNAQR
jgi:hypothetical protein